MKKTEKKKVLLVTQYFYPEGFKSNDIAFELVKKGYSVSVLTGIPNYPKGKFFSGYGFFKKRVQTINGVKVYRALLFPRGKGSGVFLALNYLSWAFFASFWALFLALFNRYDLVIVHEPSPITQGIPAVIVKKIRKIPLYFWVLDLWPESLVSAGGINNTSIIRFFTKLTKFIYKQSDKILISSKGFKQSILKKGDFENRIVYFPNWAEDVFCGINKNRDYKLPSLPQGFIVMFAGNIGEAQDFDSIMQAALLLKDHTEIKFVLVGDGRKREWVNQFIKDNSLENTCYTLGRHPLESMPSFFSYADAMLVTLKDELIFNLTVPAKVQAYMAASKPILTMLNGEGSKLIKECNCGLTANAGDYNLLVNNILTLYKKSNNELKEMGDNGFYYFSQNFTREKCINHLVDLIED